MKKSERIISRRDFLKATMAALVVSSSSCNRRAISPDITEQETTHEPSDTYSTDTVSTANQSTTATSPKDGIEILWDKWGIPHIFAASDEDAMFGLGYASAKARLIQMEVSRRIIRGTIAALLGNIITDTESLLQSDKYMRTVGFYRHADSIISRLKDEEQLFLKAYSDGVNKYISNNPGHFQRILPNLPHTPEPWKAEDCINCWMHMANFFTKNGLNEAHLPNEMGSPNPVDDSATVVKREDVDEQWVASVLQFAREQGFSQGNQPNESSGNASFSHAWVVAGSRNNTNAAVLVSDPQTPVTLPNLFFEFHLKGNTFDARGIGAPGSPMILIGWNKNVAWGVTALGGDQADLFKLITDMEHQDQYLFDRVWKKMNVLDEQIEIAGSQPVRITVKETELGPVVTPFLEGKIEPGEYALHRVPQVLSDTDAFRATISMMRSKSIVEFDASLEDWTYPPANVIFGDADGSIGYHMTGASPIRASDPNISGSSFQDGSSSDKLWRGFIPHKLQPRSFDPHQGWFATANHRAVESWYPMLQTGTGSSGHTSRSWRLYELLQGRSGSFTAADVQAIHFDDVDPARRTIAEVAVYIVDIMKANVSEEATGAIELLRLWLSRGAHCSSADPAYPLVKNMNTGFRPAATRTSLSRFGGGESGLVLFCKYLIETIKSQGAIDHDSIEYIDSSLSQGWLSCVKAYGEDSKKWPQLFKNAMLRRKMEYMTSLDGFSTISSRFGISYPFLADMTGSTIFSQESQCYTQYVPLADVDSAMSLMPIGNSEDPLSQYFSVNLDTWVAGELHPAPMSRSEIEKYQNETETLNSDT